MEFSKELQYKYFNMIAELFGQNAWSHSIVEKLIQRLSDVMEIDHLALYVHLDDSSYLRLLASVSKKDIIFKERTSASAIEQKTFFVGGRAPEFVYVFPLEYEPIDKLYLVFSIEEEIPNKLLDTIINETRKLFTIFVKTWHNAQQDQLKEFLLDTSTKLIRAHDKSDVLHVIFEALKMFYTDYKYHLILTQEYEEAAYLPIKVMEYSDEDPIPVSTQVFMTGEMQIEVMEERSEKVIYAPLSGEQSVYGVLEIIVPVNHYFMDFELKFIEEFAVLSGKALEKMILYEDSLAQVSNLTLLNEIIHELNSSIELTELTKLIRMQIIKLTKASEVGFIYFDEELDREFEILSGSTAFFNEEKGLEIAKVYKEKIMKTPDAIFSGYAVELEPYGFQSAMVIPMVYSGLSIGFTVILHEDRYHFTFDQFKLIRSLMQHSALAISNTILRERLQKTVITDFLTQLYTRRYLEDTIEEHQNSGQIGTLLLFDIDDFKRVNDRFGHHVGDSVLKQVARIMLEIVGENGVAARWGGEELAVYLPDRTAMEAHEFANRIRKNISLETEPAITVSCGISYWEKGYNDSKEKLFLRADQALYEAKSAGKDRVRNERLC